jgi:anthranilate synthase component 1
VLKNGVAHVTAGAGIVADSVPAREYEETQNKARAAERALELAERLAASDGADREAAQAGAAS